MREVHPMCPADCLGAFQGSLSKLLEQPIAFGFFSTLFIVLENLAANRVPDVPAVLCRATATCKSDGSVVALHLTSANQRRLIL